MSTNLEQGQTHTEIGYWATNNDESNLLRNVIDSNHTGARLDGSASTEFNGVHSGGNDYAAFNYFRKNTSEQILLQSAVTPYFGFVPGPGLLAQNSGRNRFESVGSQVHFRSSNGTASLTGSNNISQNDWSPSVTTGIGTTDPKLISVNFDNSANVSMSDPGYSCGAGYYQRSVDNRNDSEWRGISWPGQPDSLHLYFKARSYDGIDPCRGRDTMMAYCEQHPFALKGDGRWFSGMHWVATFSNDCSFEVKKENPQAIYTYWQPIYNWGVRIQHLNDDSLYQKTILSWLASCAGNFDRNLACNLWWNFIRLYGEDTLYRNTAYSLIAGHRYSQDANGEDTTAFEILTFPLKPLEVASVHSSRVVSGDLSLAINPNPSKGISTITG